MSATLQSIFNTSFDAYANEHRLALKHYQAARAIMTCRTPAQGGHEQCCPEGHESHIQYHSCRHRSCPKCNALPKAQWAQRQFERLLAVDHYHVIFTLPHELLALWRYNQRWFADTLFHTVSDTLLVLLRDERHLGALPGMVLSLHTWGRTLSLHPHIHCLVTGGGLDGAGQWREVRHRYLMPARVVRALYRGKLLAALWQALQSGELQRPPSQNEAELRRCLKALARKKWNVCIQPPYSHGHGVMGYLARYVKGGPLSDHRVATADERQVTFRYCDHRDGQHKIQKLSSRAFMARILEHVAEPGQHVIRHYGLYGHKARDKRSRCRAQLGQGVESRTTEITWDAFLQQTGAAAKGECHTCGRPLIRGRVFDKNSVFKGPEGRSCPTSRSSDIETWLLEGEKPPDRPLYFFGDSMSLN